MSAPPASRVSLDPVPEAEWPMAAGTGSRPAPRRRLGPALVLTFAVVITGVWAGTAVRAAGHGLDLTDEGFYLLSYRWWNADHRTFTGAQYLYGPVFALLGHDIAGLRMFRLGTVLLAHLLFGVAFLRWLRPRRPSAPPTRLWEAAGAATVVASGGAVYGWLPQSPGYNDVVLFGLLLGMAVVFTLARHAERGSAGPAWLPLAFGMLVVPVLLAKWAAALPMAVVAAAGVVAVAARGRRAVLRALAWALAGAAGAAAVVHLFVVPLTTAVPPMIAVNRTLAESSFAVPALLARYARYTLPTVETVAREYGLLLAAAALAALVRRPAIQAAAGVLGAAGLIGAVAHAVRDGGLGGGAVNVLRFVVPLLAAAVAAVLVAIAGRLDTARDRLLLGVLAALPLSYAFGTSNIPLKVSVMAFAAWMAVLVAVVTGLDRRAVAARAITAAVAAGTLLVTACAATGGLWRHPYRNVPNARATAVAPGVPALAGLRLDPGQARAYGDLRARLAPYLVPPGRRVLGFDKMAGVVLLLDGRTLGEGWYAPENPSRTRAGIAAECADGPPWTPDRAPVLVFNRPVRAADMDLLTPCGLDLARDYRPLAPPARTANLTVLVPG